MKAFFAAVIAAVGLGAIAMFALSGAQEFAYEKFSTSGARVSEPGSNLVGHHWTGGPTPADYADETREKAEEAQSGAKRS
jgi:hypothetical protein